MRLAVRSIALKIPLNISYFRHRKNWPVGLFIRIIHQISA